MIICRGVDDAGDNNAYLHQRIVMNMGDDRGSTKMIDFMVGQKIIFTIFFTKFLF